jgi:hypothetical protein
MSRIAAPIREKTDAIISVDSQLNLDSARMVGTIQNLPPEISPGGRAWFDWWDGRVLIQGRAVRPRKSPNVDRLNEQVNVRLTIAICAVAAADRCTDT